MSGGLGALIWVIIAVGLIVVEAMTAQMVCIWFACGSLLAALAAFVDAPFWLQLLVCLITSIAVLIVGRPLVLDKLAVRKQATNADRVIGELGTVTEKIDNLHQTGRVSANGLYWSARSEYGDIIPEGTPVEVMRIDGIKLIVRPAAPVSPREEEPEATQSAPREPEEAQGPINLYDSPGYTPSPSLDTDVSIDREQ